MPATWESLANERHILDMALESESGIKLEFEERGRAVHARQRLYTARSLDREHSKEVYSPGDEGYDTTPYDKVIIKQGWDNKQEEGPFTLVIISAYTVSEQIGAKITDLETGEELILEK